MGYSTQAHRITLRKEIAEFHLLALRILRGCYFSFGKAHKSDKRQLQGCNCERIAMRILDSNWSSRILCPHNLILLVRTIIWRQARDEGCGTLWVTCLALAETRPTCVESW